MRGGTYLTGVAAVLLVVVASACGREPALSTTAPAAPTAEARRTRGLELIEIAGKAIAGAPSLSFTANEQGERVRRSGEKRPVSMAHKVVVRRPDRLYIKTSGDSDTDAYYDGQRITLMMHTDKVYGVIPATGTLESVINDQMDRFDIPFPLGDMVAFTSAADIVGPTAQGGWVGEETVNGIRTDKVSWTQANLDWSIWIAVDGQRLPVRLALTYKARRGSPSRTYDFMGWQLGGTVTDATFVANVPRDYEGIPVIQRASAALGSQTPADAGKQD